MMPLVRRLLPGLALASLIMLLANVLAEIETLVVGYSLLEPLVLALVLGVVVRAAWRPPPRLEPGIAFSAKQVLEFAIVLIGFSLALGTLIDAGARLGLAILVVVSLTIVLGVGLGRAAGLPVKLTVLIGVGNAICGNSAIAAVAPVIRARKEDVASAIALTAVLGIGVVLTLPLLVPLLAISDQEYGVVAGLSVYAVPQVLAATLPVGATAGQVASLVKLSRVLLLGPVVAILAVVFREREAVPGRGLSFSKLVPWFVIGFGVAVTLRSAGLVPDACASLAQQSSRILTAVAMAGLGLSVDIRSVRETGGRVALVVLGLTVILVATAVILTLVLDLP
jgi:uncharacterized integral membrane protein (TIGR00698 family)